jgi:hypothetical protein
VLGKRYRAIGERGGGGGGGGPPGLGLNLDLESVYRVFHYLAQKPSNHPCYELVPAIESRGNPARAGEMGRELRKEATAIELAI